MLAVFEPLKRPQENKAETDRLVRTEAELTAYRRTMAQADEEQVERRSVYIFVKRSLAVPELEVLDAPDTTSS